MSLTLVIGNKAYSSWSLRPWLAMKHLGLAFDEVLVLMGLPSTRPDVLKHGASTTIPILKDGDILVWETLAILEYLNETYAGGALWPKDKAARAHARAISNEMHAGFGALRARCPMNVRRRVEPYALTPEAQQNVDRIQAIWSEARQRYGADGPFLYGAFSAADAMYAPVVMRLHFYAIPVNALSRAYMDAILAHPAMRQWLDDAAREPWVIASSEVY